jgi:hypothetical protein
VVFGCLAVQVSGSLVLRFPRFLALGLWLWTCSSEFLRLELSGSASLLVRWT